MYQNAEARTKCFSSSFFIRGIVVVCRHLRCRTMKGMFSIPYPILVLVLCCLAPGIKQTFMLVARIGFSRARTTHLLGIPWTRTRSEIWFGCVSMNPPKSTRPMLACAVPVRGVVCAPAKQWNNNAIKVDRECMCLNQFPHSYFSTFGAFFRPKFEVRSGERTQLLNRNWIYFWILQFPRRLPTLTIAYRFSAGNEHRSYSIKNDFIFPLSRSLCRLLSPKCTIKWMQSHFRHKNDRSWQIIGLVLALFQFISLRHFDLFFSFVAIVVRVSIFLSPPAVHSPYTEWTNEQRKREKNCIN